MDKLDILMVTYNRPVYTRIALEALLSTCDDRMSVWLWHNGDDAETLAVVAEFSRHSRVKHYVHSRENKRVREATNWLLSKSKANLLSKVDDDCIVPTRWADTLRAAHAANPRLGVVGCWRFQEEDFFPDAANKKIRMLDGGHRLL